MFIRSTKAMILLRRLFGKGVLYLALRMIKQPYWVRKGGLLMAGVWAACALVVVCGGVDAASNAGIDLHDGVRSLKLVSLKKNVFEATYADGEQRETGRFSPPLELELRIDGKVQRLLDPTTGLPVMLKFPSEGTQRAMIDATTLPSAAAGVYPMRAVVRQPGGKEEAVRELKVQVGCSNAQRATYMECFLNCDAWEVRW